MHEAFGACDFADRYGAFDHRKFLRVRTERYVVGAEADLETTVRQIFQRARRSNDGPTSLTAEPPATLTVRKFIGGSEKMQAVALSFGER